MPNIRSKINNHNNKKIQTKSTEPQKLRSCLVKEDCTMNWSCLISSILHQAPTKYSDIEYKQKRYKGICETTFKKGYENHKKSFNLIMS